MYPGSLPYVLPLLLTALLTGSLSLYAFRRRELAGTSTFGWLLLAITVWCIAAAVEYLAPSLQGKVLAAKIENLAIASLMPLWLAFALRYTQNSHWLTRRNQILLTLPSLVIAFLAVTDEWHHLIWRSVEVDPTVSPGLIYERGIANLIFSVYAYLGIMAGGVLYVLTFARAAPVYRMQVGLVVAGALVPFAASIMHFLGLSPMRGWDVTPFAFGISGLLLAVGLFRFNLLDLRPIAAQVLVDSLHDAVLVLDMQDRLVDLNLTGSRLFNVKQNAIGRHILDVLRPPEFVRQYLVGVTSTRVEVEFLEGKESRWFELTVSPLKDSRGELLGRAVLLHEHTRERELLKMRDDLTHMLVHDLHNPLSAIFVALDVIGVGEWDDNPRLQRERPFEEREALKIAYQSSLRAQEMLDSLLNMARLESGQMPVDIKQVNVGEIANTVVRQMTPLADDRNLMLNLDLATDLPLAQADRGLLDRVVRNLLGNAIKFIPEGGHVTLAAHAEGSNILVSVSDTGPGIPPPLLPHLFEKYARGEVIGRGYGLGLAFCRLAIETMGGRIWVDSPPGQGATFHFTVPSV
jgi:signal transduction histidine kinase